ncbi:MAG: FIVAR domain-containing protein, partial [Acutalibacteraceae bacterium]
MKMAKRILACFLSVLLILPTVALSVVSAEEEPPVVATWSKAEGLWNNYEWAQRVSTNWQTVDGDTVDLSLEEGANPNYYLAATVAVNPIDESLTEENVVEKTLDHLWVRLRTSGEAESREYNVSAAEVSVDGNVVTVMCRLSNISTFNMDWSNVTQLNFAYHLKSDYHAKDAAAVSMTLSDVKVVDMTGLIDTDPGESTPSGDYLLFSNNQTEMTSPEAHLLNAMGASTFVDLRPYAGGKVSVKFGVKANKTSNFEFLDRAVVNMEEQDWIKYINAGHFILNVQGTDGNTQNVDTFASDNGGVSLDGGKGLLADLNTEDFIYVTIPLPQWLVDSGSQITGFHIYLYNNFHAITGADLGESWDAGHGVTLTFKNVELLTDMEGVSTWEDLQAVIDATKKSDEDLARYTEESVAAFQALIDEAQAIADFKEDAAVLEIVGMIRRLKEADKLLVEGLPFGGTVSLLPDEATSAEAHYMSVVQSFVTPFDLDRYGMRESWEITLMMRVNKVAEHFPEALAETPDSEWINKIVNGSLVLYSGDNSTRVNLADVDTVWKVNCGQGQLEDAVVGNFIEVRFPIPDAILEAGQISKVEFFMYNDLHNLVEGSTANDVGSQGVTITVADVRLALGKEVVVDKTALEQAIADAEAVLSDVEKDYTADSKQAAENALNAARDVNANAKATQTEV